MILHRTLATLFVLAPGLLFAQPGFSPEEELRFALLGFQARMRAHPVQDQAPASPEAYHLVYVAYSAGGPPVIEHGYTATLATYLQAMTGDCGLSLHGKPAAPVYYGDRYAFVSLYPHTSLPRYTHWYFERR